MKQYKNVWSKIASISILSMSVCMLVGCFGKKSQTPVDTQQNSGMVASGTMLSGDTIQTGTVDTGSSASISGENIQAAAMSGIYTGTDASKDPDVQEVLKLLEDLVK